MDYELICDPQTGLLTLKGSLGIYTVASIRERLLELIARGEPLQIDLSKITEIDTAGLQLLLLAKRQHGAMVRFVNHSPPVAQLLGFTNLAGALDYVDAQPLGSNA